jgi:hypothetical protein
MAEDQNVAASSSSSTENNLFEHFWPHVFITPALLSKMIQSQRETAAAAASRGADQSSFYRMADTSWSQLVLGIHEVLILAGSYLAQRVSRSRATMKAELPTYLLWWLLLLYLDIIHPTGRTISA